MSLASSLPDRVARPIHPAVIRAVVRYVEQALGSDGRAALLEGLPAHLPTGDVLDPHRWATRDEVAEVVLVASRLCGDDQIGRRAGEEKFRDGLTTPFGQILGESGSVEAACRIIIARYALVSLGRRPQIREVHPDHLVVESQYLDPAAANRFACDYLAGYLSQIPILFDALGTVAETECRSRGDSRCVIRLGWRPDPSRHHADLSRRDRNREVVDWFEESQVTAARLVGAADVDGLLEEVVAQARQKLQAPRVLLTAKVQGDRVPRVHHIGFGEDAVAFAGRLTRGELDGDGSVVTADITSGHHTYGRLAAAFPTGSVITDAERRMLPAYARHVASALHALASLERARRDRDTARALLGLARSFSEVTSLPDVTSRLAMAIPEVTGCDAASVWLFDSDRRTIRLAGSRDRTGNELSLAPDQIAVDDFPGLVAAMRSRHPTLLSIDELPDGLRRYLHDTGTIELAFAPIAAAGRILGIVTAAFRSPVGPLERESLMERFRGLTAHASTAIQNADLLERMRHQALHDTLTGLPNRALVEDRGRQALATIRRSGGRVALLFLDLDGFKQVNDEHGHFVGDALIRHVAARLDGLMRVSDTVARMGGDEFVVLMPDIETEQDAIDVAVRINEAFRRPVHVEGRSLPVSCSIGVASTASSGAYDDLLCRADAAMYLAKARGGHGYAVDDPVVVLEPGQIISVDTSPADR